MLGAVHIQSSEGSTNEMWITLTTEKRTNAERNYLLMTEQAPLDHRVEVEGVVAAPEGATAALD